MDREKQNSANDGKADRRGRVWFGTYNKYRRSSIFASFLCRVCTTYVQGLHTT